MKNKNPFRSRSNCIASLIAILGVCITFATSAQTKQTNSESNLPPAKEIISKFVKTIGGRAAFQKIQSQHMKGKFEMPAQGLSGDLEVFAKRPDKLAVKISLQGLGEILRGYNGAVGWSVDMATGPALLEGKMLEELREQADFDGVLHGEKKYKSMETVAIADFEGARCYQLKLVRNSGNEVNEYFDIKSGLLVGVVLNQETPLGAMLVTATLGDYQETAGVLFARRITQKIGPIEQVMTITSFKENQAPDSAFEVPSEIKPLLKK